MQENNHVTQRQFFEGVADIKQSIGDLSREMGETNTKLDAFCKQVESNSDDIDDLKKADKGFTAIASGVGGGIGIVGAYLISLIKGN